MWGRNREERRLLIGRFSPYNFPCFLLKTKPKTFPSEIVNGNGQSLLSATAWPQSDRRAINYSASSYVKTAEEEEEEEANIFTHRLHAPCLQPLKAYQTARAGIERRRPGT
jgi:hypothetical protein